MIPWSPMPGGALTANTQMLRDNNLMPRYGEMIHAMAEVVKKGGFGTSVTPVSQFYFQQAFNNVLFGPWKKIAPGYGKMVLGYFGKTPFTPDAEIVRISSEQLKLEPTTEKVLDLNDRDPKKSIASYEKILKDNNLPVTDENVFIIASCEDKGLLYLKGEAKVNGVRKHEPEKDSAPAKNNEKVGYTVMVNGTNYGVELKGDKAIVNGKEYAIRVTSGIASQSAQPAAAGKTTEVKAYVPGTVLRVSCAVGATVMEGDELLVMDVMKMETPVKAPLAGTIHSVNVNQADKVNTGDVLVVLS
jgi:pyruvate carboxylase subunit B